MTLAAAATAAHLDSDTQACCHHSQAGLPAHVLGSTLTCLATPVLGPEIPLANLNQQLLTDRHNQTDWRGRVPTSRYLRVGAAVLAGLCFLATLVFVLGGTRRGLPDEDGISWVAHQHQRRTGTPTFADLASPGPRVSDLNSGFDPLNPFGFKMPSHSAAHPVS